MRRVSGADERVSASDGTGRRGESKSASAVSVVNEHCLMFKTGGAISSASAVGVAMSSGVSSTSHMCE